MQLMLNFNLKKGAHLINVANMQHMSKIKDF